MNPPGFAQQGPLGLAPLPVMRQHSAAQLLRPGLRGHQEEAFEQQVPLAYRRNDDDGALLRGIAGEGPSLKRARPEASDAPR